MPKKRSDVVVVEKHSQVGFTELPQSTSPTAQAEALIAQAISQGVPVDTMEKLLAMRRELKAEYAKEEFVRAMADFQAECPVITKTKGVKTKSGQVAYKYAPIDVIVSQTKALIQKHGFSYATETATLENMVQAVCVVRHRFGHSEQSQMTVPLGNKTDIMSQTQVVAAALTFAKRYAFCNAFGILTGDEDSDGKTMGKSDEKEVKTGSSDDIFEKAKRMIGNIKNSGGLVELDKNVSSSKLYTDEQKQELHAIISARVDELDNK